MVTTILVTMPTPEYSAPTPVAPIAASLVLPGSKSQTARELVLSALAEGSSVIERPLVADDTLRMRAALELLGATFREERSADGHLEWHVDPILFGAGRAQGVDGDGAGSTRIECGQAGTVMRFVPVVAALVGGKREFFAEDVASARPIAGVVAALKQLGVSAEVSEQQPFLVVEGPALAESTPGLPGHPTTVTIDASASSQFVSALLLAAARFPNGLHIRHEGERLPSQPHIDMTIEALARRGVTVEQPSETEWVVRAGVVGARRVRIEPDLSNAAPFLAGTLLVPGTMRIADWPSTTTQVGQELLTLLPEFVRDRGASWTHTFEPNAASDSPTASGTLTVTSATGPDGQMHLNGVNLDLSDAGELAPSLIALGAVAAHYGHRSEFRGIGHLRHHESDRLHALATNLAPLGTSVEETPEGLILGSSDCAIPTPESNTDTQTATQPSHTWPSHNDHRIATSGAVLGLTVPGIRITGINATTKTFPEFVQLWDATFSTGVSPESPEPPAGSTVDA